MASYPISEKLASTDQISLEQLKKVKISSGDHTDRAEGVCIMEAVAWFAGKPHSDKPPCVDPDVAGILIYINDESSETERQKLKALIPVVVGTKGLYKDILKSLRKPVLEQAVKDFDKSGEFELPEWITDDLGSEEVGNYLLEEEGMAGAIKALTSACNAAKANAPKPKKAKKKAKKSR